MQFLATLTNDELLGLTLDLWLLERVEKLAGGVDVSTPPSAELLTELHFYLQKLVSPTQEPQGT